MSPKKEYAKSDKSISATEEQPEGFSKEERAAMKERAQELKAAARAEQDKLDGESAVLAKIAEMEEPDRSMAERLHAILKVNAPSLTAKTWYGMPAYAQDGKLICFFQSGQKFKTRYATLGFSDSARLDDGNMWPNAYALTIMTAAEEARIIELVQRAIS